MLLINKQSFTLKIWQNKIVTLFSCFLDFIAIIFVPQFLKYYTMTRKAFLALIDDITFDYYGNQITKATDAVSDGPYYQGAWHYRDRTDADEERTYDANGNLISDSDANISDIQYNSLNLSLMNVGCGSEKPKQVWFFAHLSLTLSDSDSVH